jgi:hypothetical protein
MQSHWAEVKSGAYIATRWLLTVGWVCLVAYGAGLASSDAPHRALGWILVVLAGVIAIVTVDRWVKVLPGILGLAVLNLWIAVWTGHAGSDPAAKVPRLTALAMLLAFVACGALSAPLQSRKLTAVDRFALLGFLGSLGLAFVGFPSLMGFSLMVVSLGVPWGVGLVERHRKPTGKRRAT